MYAMILTFPRILYQAREDFEARRPWLVQLIHHIKTGRLVCVHRYLLYKWDDLLC